MWKISRYWNRIAFLVVKIGWKMIWDQSGVNEEWLSEDDPTKTTIKEIMCEIP